MGSRLLDKMNMHKHHLLGELLCLGKTTKSESMVPGRRQAMPREKWLAIYRARENAPHRSRGRG